MTRKPAHRLNFDLDCVGWIWCALEAHERRCSKARHTGFKCDTSKVGLGIGRSALCAQILTGDAPVPYKYINDSIQSWRLLNQNPLNRGIEVIVAGDAYGLDHSIIEDDPPRQHGH